MNCKRSVTSIIREDEWRAVEYLNILSMMPPGHHSQKMIESIYEKIRGIDETNDKDDSSYVLLGRVYSVLNRIRELLAVLGTVDYINKLIHISYKGKGEELIECVIATGRSFILLRKTSFI